MVVTMAIVRMIKMVTTDHHGYGKDDHFGDVVMVVTVQLSKELAVVA